MNEMLDPGAVEIQYDAHGVLLVDTRDPMNLPNAWPRWRFTREEWDDLIDRAIESRPQR